MRPNRFSSPSWITGLMTRLDAVAADAAWQVNDKDMREFLKLSTHAELAPIAAMLRDQGHGDLISYSRKVFIPFTQLCRDVCHYCTFAHPPKRGQPAFMSKEQVLAVAERGKRAGCTEALFTLGEKPELRYRVAREELAAAGFPSTVRYVAAMAELVFEETGLFPHINAGTLTLDELELLRAVSVSQGLMLESTSERLCERGGPHFGSPDKRPEMRLETLRLAGQARIPFTTGVLIGIGETLDERLDALFAIRDLHHEHGHIQEVIIQNFRAKPGTKMAGFPEPSLADLLWTIACARIILGPQMNVQAPPNLSRDDFPELIDAGINDWGGISPVTADFVNPEAPWPEIERLALLTRAKGKNLVHRLPTYRGHIEGGALSAWHDRRFVASLLAASDASGLARADQWAAGDKNPFDIELAAPQALRAVGSAVREAHRGRRLEIGQVVSLFEARDRDLAYVVDAADELRREMCGDTVSYVVNRNINYTNICYFKCRFCAFSKGKTAENLRGKPYNLGVSEVVERAIEAWERGATEVCLQGGIHPDYTGQTYLDICRGIKDVLPAMHVHAFSPLEVSQGAHTLGLPVDDFLCRLIEAGLGSLPGTAAEILDDEVRRIICPDKLSTDEWLSIVRSAHRLGLKTTATIMFGHVEGTTHLARHLLRIRDLQADTGGFTEFVPLPFVHSEAPIFLKGLARKGPTKREVMLMHAVSRLVLHPLIPNIQASWVKLGVAGVRAMLDAGVNDLGGTLMNESISRAAGADHGQEFAPEAIESLIRSAGRVPRLRTTLYADGASERHAAAMTAAPLRAIN